MVIAFVDPPDKGLVGFDILALVRPWGNELMTRMIWLALGLAALTVPAMGAEPPQAQIQNKQLRLKIYLPDAKDGFYRGTRFDWSGVIGDLEFAGHHLYQPWFASTDASVRDFIYKDADIIAAPNSAMTGPVEEFQAPIGYDTAKPGENFLKVGVGILRKADDTPYQFGKHFDLVDGGKWTVTKTKTSVTFQQVLGDGKSDYGYVYTKTIRLVGETNALVIEHRLRNTGKLPIRSKVYDHNFLTMDGLGVGSAYSIQVPYKIESKRLPDAKFARIDGSTAEYVADLQGQDRVQFGLEGFSAEAKDYDFRIVNKAAKLQVRMVGDRPLVGASLWSIRDVMAVEPFIDVAADPGKEMLWSYTYTYETVK